MASVNRANPKANAKKKQALSNLNSNKYKILAAAEQASGDGTSASNNGADSLNSSSLLKSLDLVTGNADLLGAGRRPSPLVDLKSGVPRPSLPISQKTIVISKPTRPVRVSASFSSQLHLSQDAS